MGAAALPLAAAGSIASAGFGAASSLAQGEAGRAQAQAAASKAEFDAQRAERAAEIGRVQAAQTDATLREELNTTLANIDAISAASNVAPNSPTRLAIKEHEAEISDRQRRSRVASIRMQADEDTRTAGYDRSVAAYQRSVGKSALLAGSLGAAGKITGGIGQAARGYG